MPRNEEGEYELLLGNRQLLSVFVIVVVLLGIFFAMGYVAGKNSGAPILAASKPGEAAPAEQAAAPSNGNPSPKASAASGEVAAPPTDAAPVPVPVPPPQASAEAAAKPSPVVDRDSLRDVAEPASGQTFLQITAVARHDAELVSDTLNKRNFPARIAPGPKGLYRVLVGPVRDAASLARLRTSLEEAGFRNPIVRKY